jgi:hypothetical protein
MVVNLATYQQTVFGVNLMPFCPVIARQRSRLIVPDYCNAELPKVHVFSCGRFHGSNSFLMYVVTNSFVAY